MENLYYFFCKTDKLAELPSQVIKRAFSEKKYSCEKYGYKMINMGNPKVREEVVLILAK